MLVAVLNGCAFAPSRAPTVAPKPLPAEIAAYYSYSPRTATPTVQLVRERRAFREYLVQFPLSTSGFEPTEPVVEFEWMESKMPGRRPAILVNPILGGDYPLERGICRYFAARGFHVALIHRKTLKISPEHQVERIELLLRQGILRIRQIVDWMSEQERIDPQRLGSFGISMGGIAGVMSSAVEPRFRAHVVALAGGSIPDILMTSRDSLLTKPRKRYLERNGMDLATMDRLLREHIKTDPIALAPYADTRRMLMFVALADRTIGARNGLRLWRELGKPKTTFMFLGHYTAYFSLPYLKYESLRFFRRTL
ncbi:MAG: hypothetical protein COV75_03600 [Candidatus Omnitrophica bacterium CG11_big_fil_rev_8_21_14_0_20_63_9]|nr:MAG: hypothetical protein COV75_03600 [Candidatus Omnitrophica bacterium CG11_big_fil_rev_8_21_14_0_20_63_9]